MSERSVGFYVKTWKTQLHWKEIHKCSKDDQKIIQVHILKKYEFQISLKHKLFNANC